MRREAFRGALVSGLAAAISGCGGGSGGSGGSDRPGGGSDDPAFTQAEVAQASQIKTVQADWTFEGSVEDYVLEINPDGASGYSRADVNGDGRVDADDRFDAGTSEAGVKVPAHLADPDQALYQIVALDAQGNELARSSELSLSSIPEEELAGYIKAGDPPQPLDRFGWEVKVSDDGSTLAVSAPAEDGDYSGDDLDQKFSGGVSSKNAGGNECVRQNPSSSDSASRNIIAGAVYVYTRAPDGTWGFEDKLQGSNTNDHNCFGSAIDLSTDGDRLIVGAESERVDPSDDTTTRDAGAAYVFDRDADGSWSQTSYIKPSLNGGEFFGSDVALSGDGTTLVAGAQQKDKSGETEAGAVYVYTLDGNGNWTQQSLIQAANAVQLDTFGESVALSANGDTLAVGAVNEAADATGIDQGDTISTNHSSDTPQDVGAVYVYTRNDSGNWSRQVYIKPDYVGPNAATCSKTYCWEYADYFGTDVALTADGNTLVVGANGDDSDATGVKNTSGSEFSAAKDNSLVSAGAAYVYARSAGSWSRDAYIKASNTDANEWFGTRVAVSPDGDTIAVGAPDEGSATTGVNEGGQSDNSIENGGAVYVYDKDGGDWSQRSYVKAPVTDQYDYFGRSVALSRDGNVLAVGAQGEASGAFGIEADRTFNRTPAAGAAYLY